MLSWQPLYFPFFFSCIQILDFTTMDPRFLFCEWLGWDGVDGPNPKKASVTSCRVSY
jgi:hypothetical protein